MHTQSGRRLLLAACGALVASLALPAAAQDYPSKPIRLVIPFAAGGSVSAIVRAVAERASQGLGQPIVVDNRGGGGGNIGAAEVARAAPDGYTIGLGTISTHAINPSLYKAMQFDAVKDFAPITLFGILPNALTVNASAPYKTVAELVAWGKANPGKLNYASPSAGTTAHLSGEQLKQATGIDMQHIPYKGGAPAVTDLIAGNVQLMFADIGTALPHIRSGRLRALAVTRAEAGIRDFELSGWMGLFAPAKTPPAVVARLNREFVAALNAKDVRDQISELSLQPQPMTPAQFASFVQAENLKWARLVKASGATAE
jgi:tripartite-type tricarboxylate transporter receptor subunit TctC